MSFFDNYGILKAEGFFFFKGAERRMKYKKITIFYSIVIFLIFLLAIVTVVIPKVLSVTPYLIKDEAMAPEYKKGGLVFVGEEPEPIHVGDTITYYENQGKAIKTRRVLAVDSQIDGYFVKGDNNIKAEMGLVHERNLIGRPRFYLPYLGFLANARLMNIVKISLFALALLLTFSTLFLQPELHKQYRRQFD